MAETRWQAGRHPHTPAAPPPALPPLPAAISMLLPGRTNRAVKNLFVGNLKWGARLPEIQNRWAHWSAALWPSGGPPLGLLGATIWPAVGVPQGRLGCGPVAASPYTAHASRREPRAPPEAHRGIAAAPRASAGAPPPPLGRAAALPPAPLPRPAAP
jgi:hypothetical protein